MALFGRNAVRLTIRAHLRFYVPVAVLCVVLTILGLWSARSLRLNTDLESLLPKQAPSVVAMNILKPKTGGAQDFRLVLSGGSLQERLKMADDFSSFLTEKKWASAIRFKTPKAFLEDKKLYLIPLKSLESLHDKIIRERKEHDEIVDPFGLEKEEASETAASAATQATSPGSKSDEEKSLDQAKQFLGDLDAMRPYYQTVEGDYLVVRIIPRSASLNITENHRLLDELTAFVAEFKASHGYGQIHTEIYGSLYDQIQKYESILNDLSTGSLGILFILLIVILFFRSLIALIAIVPPLVLGLSVGAGVAQRFEGRLNTIAAFLVMVVFGVGIEFGIHLWARYIEERKRSSVADALRLTWETTGLATLTSSTALLAGFALLTVSSFQGFSQFGRVAIILVIAVAGSFVLFMPSWILVAEKVQRSKPWPETLASHLGPFLVAPLKRLASLKFLRATSIILALVGVAICLLHLRFDYQFEDSSPLHKRSAGQEALGRVFTERLKPSAMAAFHSPDEAFHFAEFYREHKESYPDIALVSGLDTFLPPDLEARMQKLKLIADDLEPWWIKRVEDERLRKALNELQTKAPTLKAFSMDDIPEELRSPLIASDGSEDRLVFLYDIGGATDGRKSIKFSKAVDHLKADSGLSPPLSGHEIILADIVTRVVSEGPWLLLGMLILVSIICWFDFRSWRFALVTMAPVIYGFILTGLVIAALGMKINFYNMVALASLGSMVVDNSIHLFHRFLESRESGEADPAVFASEHVSPTIFLCTATSIFGYSGMAMAAHSGVSSLGWVAVWGLLSCMIASIVFFPAWLALSRRP